MKLLIDGKLALPPSSVSCFRDVTLYSSVFGEFEVLVESKKKNRDQVWSFLKQQRALDFVDDFVRPAQEHGVSLSYKRGCNICVTRITANNLEFIINRLSQLSHQYRQFDVSDDPFDQLL